jgi:hypothetical protein
MLRAHPGHDIDPALGSRLSISDQPLPSKLGEKAANPGTGDGKERVRKNLTPPSQNRKTSKIPEPTTSHVSTSMNIKTQIVLKIVVPAIACLAGLLATGAVPFEAIKPFLFVGLMIATLTVFGFIIWALIWTLNAYAAASEKFSTWLSEYRAVQQFKGRTRFQIGIPEIPEDVKRELDQIDIFKENESRFHQMIPFVKVKSRPIHPAWVKQEIGF